MVDEVDFKEWKKSQFKKENIKISKSNRNKGKLVGLWISNKDINWLEWRNKFGR